MSEDKEDPKFKALRHRFYKLGKHGPGLLEQMAAINTNTGAATFSKDQLREALFGLHKEGKISQLESLIEKKEAEILAEEKTE